MVPGRITLYWVCFILLLMGTGILGNMFPRNWERFTYGIGGTLVAILVTWLFLKTEKSTFREIGLYVDGGTVQKLVMGLLIGSVLFGGMILVLTGATDLHLVRSTEEITLTGTLFYLSIIPLALMEEIAFRSYPFIKLERACGLRITQIIVAVAFALYHVVGGQGIYSSFLGPGIWAFVFGLAAARSGGIALPTGIHVALNVLQGICGMKGDYAAAWMLEYEKGTKASEWTEILGLILHLFILAAAVVATELYIRRKKA